MTERPPKSADWHVDWDGHRESQIASVAEATPAQRLAWLEEAIRLAYLSGALPRDSED